MYHEQKNRGKILKSYKFQLNIIKTCMIKIS